MRDRLFTPACQDNRAIFQILEEIDEFFDRENDGKAFSLLVGKKLWMETILPHGTIILGKPATSTYAPGVYRRNEERAVNMRPVLVAASGCCSHMRPMGA